MFVISKDKKRCVNCGNCTAIMPGLGKHLLKHKQLLMSAESLRRNQELVDKVLEKCYLEALTMHPYTTETD